MKSSSESYASEGFEAPRFFHLGMTKGIRRLPPKVLNIRVRASKPLAFLANILNILNINALYSSDINTIYIECMHIKYIVAILLHAYGVCNCDITVCTVAIAAYT